MSKRTRLTGRERREARRRQRDLPKVVRQRVALVAAVAGTPILIALVLILFVINGGGGDGSTVAGTPTPSSNQQGTPTPALTPGPATPPALEIEPTFTDSGLGIIDIEPGTGATPEAGQTLLVSYTGWLSDTGEKFDSSLDRGQPIEFALGTGQVIPGWEEGLATMRVGGKRRLIIPADLAYGAAGSPPLIPPNSELTFDVELLEAKAAP